LRLRQVVVGLQGIEQKTSGGDVDVLGDIPVRGIGHFNRVVGVKVFDCRKRTVGAPEHESRRKGIVGYEYVD
jgi:hypothetical protein